MKKLSKYMKFDFPEFVKGKKFEVANVKEHKVYEDDKAVGTDGVSVTLAVVSDATDYGQAGISNLYQTFTVKIIGARLDDALGLMKPGDPVYFVHYKKASVYGQYRDQLSVQVDSISDLKVG